MTADLAKIRRRHQPPRPACDWRTIALPESPLRRSQRGNLLRPRIRRFSSPPSSSRKSAGHGITRKHRSTPAPISSPASRACAPPSPRCAKRVLDVDVLMVLAALGAALIGAPFEGALAALPLQFLQCPPAPRHGPHPEGHRVPAHAAPHRGPRETRRQDRTRRRRGHRKSARSSSSAPASRFLWTACSSEGSTNVDESSLTGESMPVSKSLGSQLFAGTLNQSGGIELTRHQARRGFHPRPHGETRRRGTGGKIQDPAIPRNAPSNTTPWESSAFTIGVFLVPWLFRGETFATTRSIGP